MKLFFNNPAFRLVEPAFDRVELVEPLVVVTGFGEHVIPAGFVCDLESVPRLAQVFFPKLGKGAMPGVIHDHLYRTGVVTQPMADAIYLEALKQRRVSCVERWTKYLVLRLVGWVAWNEHRRAEKTSSQAKEGSCGGV